MACIVVTDQIRVRIDSNEVAVPASEISDYGNYRGQKSALQRPDMSRMRLAAMLRRSARPKAASSARRAWAVMLDRCVAACANTNAS